MHEDAAEKGIKIPKKLKVVGYDGLDFTRFLTPELTTVRQNVPEIAKRSVDTIIRMIDGKKIEEMEQIVDVTFRKEKVPEGNKTGNRRILHHSPELR